MRAAINHPAESEESLKEASKKLVLRAARSLGFIAGYVNSDGAITVHELPVYSSIQ